jgi:CHAT domain-containing protein
MGPAQDGERLHGLRHALTVAGVRSTLLSLWKVEDEATAGFMRRNYTRLLLGERRLQAVQQEFRTAPKLPGWSHPHHWSAWQLSGDVSPLPP